MMKLTLDIEVYKNYLLVMFKQVGGNKVRCFEMTPTQPLNAQNIKTIMAKYTTIGFNSINFDLPILAAAINGADNQTLKDLADKIIVQDMKHWQLGIEVPANWDHIDIKEPAPGVMTSLKTYGARMHASKLQDLPIEPNASINPTQYELMRQYCLNDLETTEALYTSLLAQFDLREKMSAIYGENLMSKSDAQIAEVVIKTELTKEKVRVNKSPIKPGQTFKYKMPDFIKFNNDVFNDLKQRVIDSVFTIEKTGSVKIPKLIADKVPFDGAAYQFGIGGLHSTEEKQAIIKRDGEFLCDFDVASFYPNIILGQNLHPKHLTPKFLNVYKSIVDKRIAAKKTGDKVTADSLKITINGSYGKFGSKYSFLYSPDLMIQTTITGQLSLLMLIEQVTAVGARVVSANTDGIVIHGDNAIYNDVLDVCFDWELQTGYELEETRYNALYSANVNNYIAVKDKGVKCKGWYAPAGLSKNPTNLICVDAVIAHITEGAPIKQTITSCSDITKFLTVRAVKGGGEWGGEYLGKVVRWYHSTNGAPITYKTNGNKVAKSDGSKPLMDLPDEIPTDIDYQVYINEAQNILEVIGYA